MNHDDCDRLGALAPAMALGALDSDEAEFARAHLAICRRPHAELREAVALAAAIGSAMPDPDMPSPDLRGRLLDAARRDGAPPLAASPPMARPRDVWRWLAAGAGALAVAASLALAVQVGENRALDERLGAADARLAAVETQLDTATAWIDRAVARGATAFFMDGEGQAQEASFMLVVEDRAVGGVLLMSGLPALSPDQTYELWVERDGAVVAAGTFQPDARGLAAVAIDASLAGIRQAMITVEPIGGSSGPNVDTLVMEGELSL